MSRITLLSLVALAVIGAQPAAAQVRFSVGTGGFSVGNAPPPSNYPHGYGSGYRNYYGARPNYEAAVYRDNTYRAPVVRYVRPAPEPPPYAGPGVTIRNPAATGVQLSYTLDARYPYDIEAGQTQQLTRKGSYLVEFDRGGEFGRARYTITEGLYDFTLTDHGWELYRQPDHVAEAERVRSNPLPMP
jgi:hypothetical protein